MSYVLRVYGFTLQVLYIMLISKLKQITFKYAIVVTNFHTVVFLLADVKT